MSKSAPLALPDLDDVEFLSRLRPLGDMLIPGQMKPDNQTSGKTDIRMSGRRKEQAAMDSNTRKSRLSVAERIENIEQLRGPKRRFEFLIPVRVGEALATDAANRGQSAATRLLEVLRDAGYPVIPEDFVDLRKEKGRG